MKWDYEAGQMVPYRAVDYGEELYQKALKNAALQKHKTEALLHDESNGKNGRKFLKKKQSDSLVGSGATSSSSFGNLALAEETKCPDFSVPAYNSSLKKSKELVQAINYLNKLPTQIEKMMRSEKYDPILSLRASKTLNFSKDAKIFKDLLPVQPNDEVVSQLRRSITETVQSVRPQSRSRDPEPNLLDYQDLSFSRIKPKAVPPPPKPESEVNVDLSHPLKHIKSKIQSEHKFEEDAERM